MKKLVAMFGLLAVVAGCDCGKCENAWKESGTTFARDALQKYVDSGEMPGAISVFYKDGVQETACVGFADYDAKRPITLDDVYMQCSQTKGFCGVTIAMLVEEGKLNLDDPVSKYLPEFKELWVEKKNADGTKTLTKAKNALTVRMVMNHTGGFPFELPNGIAMGGWSRRMPLRSVAATAASQSILFEPGTKAQYSNVGIDIGAAVVEIVTGKRWEEFLKERVLGPLGMKDTGFWPTDEQLAHKIELYDVKGGEKAKWKKQADWMQRPYNDDRVFSSAGAGLSSPSPRARRERRPTARTSADIRLGSTPRSRTRTTPGSATAAHGARTALSTGIRRNSSSGPCSSAADRALGTQTAPRRPTNSSRPRSTAPA